MGLVDTFHTPLPYGAIGFGVFWHFVYCTLTEHAIKFILPASSYQKLQIARKQDKELNQMCHINATALIHAFATVPLAFLCVTSLSSLWDNPTDGKSILFDAVVWIMAGYFIWDALICLRNIQQYGILFLLHAVISFIGLYGQAASSRSRMPYYAATFMLTEISTPFLHIRWFLTKAKETNTGYFKLINSVFLITFVVYRLILVEIFGFIPFIRLIYFGSIKNAMSLTRKIETSVVIALWLLLNYYWGFLLLKSQLRQLKRSSKVAEQKKS